MPHTDNRGRSTVIDFATKTVFGHELTDSERTECRDTLRDLVESFGANAIISAVSELGIVHKNGSGNEHVMQAIRAFCLLILESDRPKLTAQLVGKLVHLELATGKRIHLRHIGLANGISKQAVSNRLKLYAARLNLPRPDSQPLTRQAHRLMNRRNYGNRPHSALATERDASSTV